VLACSLRHFIVFIVVVVRVAVGYFLLLNIDAAYITDDYVYGYITCCLGSPCNVQDANLIS
jgi:hypothetical protein